MSGYPEYTMDAEGDPYQYGEGSKRRMSSSADEGEKVTKRRSRTACLQCRSRKSKCGTLPPDPCPSCIELGLPCKWPAEDGRSATARSRRANGRRAGSLVQGIKPDVLADDALKTDQRQGWLQSLLNNEAPNDYGMPLQDPYYPPITNFDPADFVRAVTSHLPIVEETTPTDDAASPATRRKSRMVKITWWRPHGQTAIAPGLKRITLKVRVNAEPDQHSPHASGSLHSAQEAVELHGPGGEVSPAIMMHLLGLFFSHLGSFFPSLERMTLESQVDKRTGSVFLFNAIASSAARFSNHRSLAVPGVQASKYGDPFTKVAKAMMGTMMSVPSRDTVAGLLLLALVAAGDDSESEVWMFIGMAARMGLDLGLHINPPADSDITPDDRRLNRLLFWSILILDHALSFGVGRPTTFPFRGITQLLPVEEDIHHDQNLPPCRSAFPYAAKLMHLFGSLINALNGVPSDITPEEIRAVQDARGRAITEYSLLPADMQWVMQNLQMQSRANQSSIFVFMHLWVHTILASEHLTKLQSLHQSGPKPKANPPTPTPNALWRNSARTIGDILVLCDVIDPKAYVSMPLVNQCFYVAGCCFVKEIEESQVKLSNTTHPGSENPHDISHAILTSVARTNIATLQRGLENMTKHWSGIAWIAGSLEQRIQGLPMDKLDLVDITEKMATFVSLPDAGLAGREGTDSEAGNSAPMQQIPSTSPARSASSYDFSNFWSNFDLNAFGSSSNVTEQHVPIPNTLDPEWFLHADI